jgi:hypothetical protein
MLIATWQLVYFNIFARFENIFFNLRLIGAENEPEG